MTKSITRSIMLIVILLVIMFSVWKFGDKPWKILHTKPVPVVDSSWNFEHCTSNSSSDCGRLE